MGQKLLIYSISIERWGRSGGQRKARATLPKRPTSAALARGVGFVRPCAPSVLPEPIEAVGDRYRTTQRMLNDPANRGLARLAGCFVMDIIRGLFANR